MEDLKLTDAEDDPSSKATSGRRQHRLDCIDVATITLSDD